MPPPWTEPHLTRWSGVCPLAGRAAQPPPARAPAGRLCSAPLYKTWKPATAPTAARWADCWYCRRSANLVGRLLLHLYGVCSAQAPRESDAICCARLIFWQDLSVDAFHGALLSARRRLRRPWRGTVRRSCRRCSRRLTTGAHREHARWARHDARGRAAGRTACQGALAGIAAVVVQGGLRILDKGWTLHGHSLCHRPRLRGGMRR